MAKVLVVDDASFMRNSLKYIVESAGHEVVGMASDGAEAVKLHKDLNPDVTTMDVLMGGDMDGIQTLEAIRKQAPDAKVIMVTALGQETKQEEARKLGAVGYIRKPFKQQQIVEEIERVMKG